MPQYIFYRPTSPERPHLDGIDFADPQPDGSYKGRYCNKTETELQEEYGEICVMELGAFVKAREEGYITEPQPSTDEEFDRALNCLPPMRWGTWMGVESFRLTEFYTGNITSIYARSPDGRCWQFRDNAYLSGEAIAAKILRAAEVEQLVHA